MNASHWGHRVYRRDAAARCCGIHPKNLDTLIIRMRSADVLFSERRGGARVFSARDICVLRIAWELEQAGQTWLTALARAFENLEAPPDEHALLVTPATSVSAKSSWITTVAPQPSDKSLIVIPIGRFVAEVLGKLKSEIVALQ